MKAYSDVELIEYERPFDQFARGVVPVAIELLPGAETLEDFIHPENAVYVFGPEDGSIDRSFRSHCHRFVFIPSRHCLNLAAAVNVVLYDRVVKRHRAGIETIPPMEVLLRGDRVALRDTHEEGLPGLASARRRIAT